MSKSTSPPEDDEPVTAKQVYDEHRAGLEKLAARDDLAGEAAQVLLEMGSDSDGE